MVVALNQSRIASMAGVLFLAIFATWCVVTASLLARFWGRKAAVGL